MNLLKEEIEKGEEQKRRSREEEKEKEKEKEQVRDGMKGVERETNKLTIV